MLERFGIMTDTQAIDFKGTRVRCFFSGSTDYQMDYSRRKSYVNDQSLLGENLNEMRSSIWNWQT